jgi:hypothetical protein
MALGQSSHTPALSESGGYRYLTFGALYVAQGLPLGLLLVTVPAWLAQRGLGAVGWWRLLPSPRVSGWYGR